MTCGMKAMGESMDELDKQKSGQHGTRMAPWCFLQLFVNCTCYTVFLLFPDFESLQEAIAVRFPAREAIMIVRSHLRCSRPGS